MKRNMMRRNLLRSIRSSLGRYVAIVAIIALGAGIFVGLRTTKSDMIATGQKYMDQQNMFDLRLLSTYGWERDDVAAIAKLEGIESAEGVISLDAIVAVGEDETEHVYKLYSIPQSINKVYLHGGRMPQSPNECLADGFHATDDILGKTVTVSGLNDEETLDSLTQRTFTIVGYVSTPLYMDMTRGNTALGDGTLSAYLYLPEEAFSVDYYTEIAVTLPGESLVYTEGYQDLIDSEQERVKPLLLPLAEGRYERLRNEAEQTYQDGLREYNDGLSDYEKAKQEAYAELADAEKALLDGEQKLLESEKLLEDNKKLLQDGQKQLDSGKRDLAAGRLKLAKTKAETYAQLSKASSDLIANYKQVNDGLKQVNDGISQIDSGITQIDSGITQLESGLSTLETMIGVTNTLLPLAQNAVTRAEKALEAARELGADSVLIQELTATLDEAKAKVAEYERSLAQMQQEYETYTLQLEELRLQRQELLAQKETLLATRDELNAALVQIEDGFLELQSAQDEAEKGFAAAEAELEAAQYSLDLAQIELDEGKRKLEEGTAELEKGRQELADGRLAYEDGLKQADEEFANAWAELSNAKEELDEGRRTIDSMDAPDVFLLGRNTNVGYMALDSNSDIVEGVSTVFPAFFLLISALVCITTMTRMVEEERTQIGTLKALGYSRKAIIGKYMAYAGSAAVLGCGLGVFVGSAAFPLILWEVYQIIIFLGDYYVLQIDWPLCLLVVGVYTAVTLLVTWWCCRLSLREVPAELIRPKPPTSGRAIFLEKLSFWHRLSFLNKVMLRNIFRYRQRLLMMLVGIGGCTALLLTGFGIRDSIGDLADYQFDEITLYDISVRFDHDMTAQEQQEFREGLTSGVEDLTFFHQSSVELSYNDRVSDVNFIAADDSLGNFIDFHVGKTKLSSPRTGEALVSAGIAERFGIQAGDLISVRDPDLQTLTLRVTGIFDNYVYNYVITSPQTLLEQWGDLPEMQMACIKALPDADVRQLGVAAGEMDSVVNVSVNQDTREQVGKMLEALNLVVVTVVICAAMLAVIVLYNLTNINITERLREIATIKVLGFRAGETAAYVFKENLLLSVMGAVLGLGGGVLLLDFVMSKIQVDMVWMSARLLPISFVWSVVITLVSTLIVDFVLFFRLERINMAEALKSVE